MGTWDEQGQDEGRMVGWGGEDTGAQTRVVNTQQSEHSQKDSDGTGHGMSTQDSVSLARRRHTFFSPTPRGSERSALARMGSECRSATRASSRNGKRASLPWSLMQRSSRPRLRAAIRPTSTATYAAAHEDELKMERGQRTQDGGGTLNPVWKLAKSPFQGSFGYA